MKLYLFLVLFGCCAHSVFAQANVVDSILKANTYTISIEANGMLGGSGTGLLLQKTKDAQFVAIGENHNSKEIPQFTTALFHTLYQSYGFKHLALEQDPPMMRTISSTHCKGNRDSVLSLARRYRYGFTFISDEELDMIANVSACKTNGNSVWGCDQSFGAMHVLDMLKKHHPRDAQLDTLIKKVNNYEAVRDLDKQVFMSLPSKRSDLLALKRYATGSPDNELDFGIASLLASDSIYTLMVSKKANDGCSVRERYMKSRFMEEYQKSVAAGEPMPKVLLKLGTSHILEGFEPNTSAINLGTFVKEFAIANNKSFYSINAKIFRTDSSDWNFDLYEGKEVMKLFSRNASISNWTLFDLSALKSCYYNGGMKGVIKKEDTEFFEKFILAFDALLLIGNGNDGTFTVCNCSY